MTFDWWTLALQTVNFLILVWLLWRFLYKPVKSVIEKRRSLSDQAFKEAETQRQAAEKARQDFETAQAELRKERQATLNTLHIEFEAERQKLLQDTRAEANDLIEAARATIAEERAATLRAMREQLVDLAVDMAATLLGKTDSDGLNEVFLRQLEKQIESLPDEERGRLEQDLLANGGALRVVTARPLTAEEKEHWRARLGARLGGAAVADFTADSDLIGGAELRFPHAVLKFTWAEQLDMAKHHLTGNDSVS